MTLIIYISELCISKFTGTPLRILITGATGATGGYSIEQLLSRGHQVRALAHQPDQRSDRLTKLGAEVVFGNFLDFDSIRSAMEGIQRAYFCYPIVPGIIQATTYFALAAKEAGVDTVVNMSQKPARREAKSNSSRDHWIAERVLDWSGIPYVTHLRSTYFAEWLLYLAPMIRQGVMYVPFGNGRHAPIAASDQARVITGILENPIPHAGQAYPLYGPKEMTHEEISQVIAKVIEKPIQFKTVPFDEFWKILATAQDPNSTLTIANTLYGAFRTKDPGDTYIAQHLRNVAIDHDNGIFTGTNDIVEKIGGQPPTSVEAFVTQHKQAFL